MRRQFLTVLRLAVLPAARVDFIEIVDFTALDSPECAASFAAESEAKLIQATSSGK